MSMTHDPSHRMPPRQERWPSATPAEGWPTYRDADAYRGGEQGGHWYETDRPAAYPATRQWASYQGAAGESGDRGYSSPVATDSFPPAGDGYGYQAGGYPTEDYQSGGYPAEDYQSEGYPGARSRYPVTGDGFDGATDGFNGAPVGYSQDRNGYGQAGNGYSQAGDGYGQAANGYGCPEDGNGYAEDSYAQTGNGDSHARDGYSHAGDGYYDAAGGYDHSGDGYDWAGDGYQQGDEGYADDLDGYDWEPDGYRTTTDGSAAGPNDLGPGSYTEYHERLPGDPGLTAPDAGVHPDAWQAEQDSRREARRRGMLTGAVTEILGIAVAIGVSTLVAGLIKAQTSPAAAMGDVFIDRTPAALRGALVQHFGAHGRTVLLLGMYAAIAFAALVIGMTARRGAALGAAGIAAFTLAAAFVTITRPGGHVGDVTPAVIGGVAGVAAMLWLVRASAAPQSTAPQSTVPQRTASQRTAAQRTASQRTAAQRTAAQRHAHGARRRTR